MVKLRRFWRWLTHEFLGWHNCKGSTVMSYDGCSIHATCTCGKAVMQDSQGNWF